MKAKLGRRHVRPWKWVPFINPARTDGAKLYHWRRAADEGKEYPFARFNKVHDFEVSFFVPFSGNVKETVLRILYKSHFHTTDSLKLSPSGQQVESGELNIIFIHITYQV